MKSLTTFLLIFFFSSNLILGQVDYNESIQPIFNNHCISCHGGTSGVFLASYTSVMNSVGFQYEQNIVIPGEPDESPIIDKIENSDPEFGDRMPQTGPPYLSTDQINLIRSWIAEGANEMPVSNENNEIIPNDFSIIGNYPNPFNPQTVISFNTPKKIPYSLNIYSSSGVLVMELSGMANQAQTNITISLDGMPSGVYIYQVKFFDGNNQYVLEPQKMTLAK